MTDETQIVAASPPDTKGEVRAIAFGIAGWLVPGLGHALQQMWGRALTFLAVVGVLVIVGSGLRGNLFSSDGGDAFAALGYIADLGTGSFSLLAKFIEAGGPDVSHAYGDYGTRFLAGAGGLNP